MEAFNKTLSTILEKIGTKIIRLGQISFLRPCVLQREDVLPLEIKLHMLRVAAHEAITIKEKVNLHLVELEALDEDKLATQQNLEFYLYLISNAFNKGGELGF